MPIRAHADADPTKVAAVFEPSGVMVTYGELEERSARLANLLVSRGLRRGDHIALMMENHPRFLEVVLAALRSGLYVTAINRYLTGPEAAYILSDCGAQALITSPDRLAVCAEAASAAPRCGVRLVVGTAGEGFESYEAAIARHSDEPPPSMAGGTMLYSSGTTGRPKGIKRPLPEGRFGPANSPGLDSYGFDANSIYLSPAPLYHAAPLAFVLGTLVRGGTAIIMERFDPVAALTLIERHRVTHSQWVPTMFVRMLKLDPAERVGRDLSSHICAIHSAAPCPVEVKREMIAWWGPILREYYSSTEGFGATGISSEEWLAHPGSVGRPVGGAVLHICDEEGRELATGETGVVYFETPDTAFVYHNDTEKTASSRHPKYPNWMTVGDVGHLDAEGYLYLTDRKSFMIISGGVNVYPQAVEDQLIMHSSVEDVAVIGVPNPDLGEEVKAIVQLRSGFEPGPGLAQELMEFLSPRVARYALPRSIDFIDELPRLPTGKLYKKALRDRYWPTPERPAEAARIQEERL